ncbi:phenylacetate--CoA ligase [Geobacillus sp. 46C-IIa]|uniref:phenylacetate--CoA ligase family protein n=1 Tax=Geobacillus sp. 46C-IIa TaxID=1963025 RepID=UPI0009C05CC8|nr:AMP-binding protein [Geobacillus sp. 46C-IIa]OQP03880.1 phenylacetate--CoA ligase [Geobacillus sp. 46C-IIa]QNU26579.1 AMP-binding protein [Geobacillus sp. 46C-IIa]
MALSVREMELNLEQYQLQKINELLIFVTQFNEFYKEKFRNLCLPIRTMDEFRKLPFTTKEELVQDQQLYPPFGRNHCYPETSYVRYHQTSGTSGKPLKILDTEESWDWWRDCWIEVLKSSGVTNRDRLFLAFSFGPFIGFWSAYEAAKKMGTLVIPGGGQSSKERLYSMIENRATVLLCTPSYALHLAEVAEEMGIDLPSTPIRAIITAGEPGGSVPSTREQIEMRWGAAVYDHAGMTEMGAYGYSCSARNGLHINEAQFLAEVIDPEALQPVKEGERGELVLTNFSRYGYPLIRYRTKDIVLCSPTPCACGNPHRFLPGGIIGRADDMVVVRGVNIFPSSIETIVREFIEIKEFRIVYYTEQEMNQVKVQIESEADVERRLADRLRERIGIRIDVERVAPGSLPRFSMKAKRVIDERNHQQQVG